MRRRSPPSIRRAARPASLARLVDTHESDNRRQHATRWGARADICGDFARKPSFAYMLGHNRHDYEKVILLPGHAHGRPRQQAESGASSRMPRDDMSSSYQSRKSRRQA